MFASLRYAFVGFAFDLLFEGLHVLVFFGRFLNDFADCGHLSQSHSPAPGSVSQLDCIVLCWFKHGLNISIRYTSLKRIFSCA